jgi:integrase
VYLDRALNRWKNRWAMRTLRNFTGDDVSSYLEDLVERGHTESEIQREKTLFQSFFRWAVRSGWADGNPAAELRCLLQAPSTRSVSWSSGEQQKFLEACRRRRSTPGQGLLLPPKYLYPLTLLGLRTGLQLASLLNLEWRHVDLVGGRLVIPSVEVHAAGAIKIPLSIDALQVLKDLRAKVDAMTRPPQKVLAVLRPPVRGKRFDSRQALIDFRYARKRAGVPDGDFYSLRLSFARNCAEEGVPIKAADRMVDWEDLDELMEIYGQFAPRVAKR